MRNWKFTFTPAIPALILLFIALTVQVPAQTVGGTISGVVRDQSDAVIPNAEVVVRNTATGVTRSATSNESGLYRIANLSSGTYEMTIRATGFTTGEQKDVVLTVGAEVTANVTLRAGNVSEKVEVQGGAASVELAQSQLNHVVEERTIKELPLNGRDWTQLAQLQPGVAVVRSQNGADSLRAQRGNGVQMTISGGRPSENNFRLNGVSINDYANTGPGSSLGINLGVDAIQEFSVLTSSYSAEYGRTSGGVVNAVTKSGTNEIHGTAYMFHRNSALDAANFFTNASGLAKEPFRRHQFGGSVGGPIIKNKTFVFFDYEGLREYLGVTTVSTTLSENARNGILAAGKVTVDAAVKPFLVIYPLPNAGLIGNGDTGRYAFHAGRISNENYYIGRIDHKFSDKDSINGVYFFDDADIVSPDEFNNKNVGQASTRQAFTMEETHIFSSTLINSLRLGFSRTVAGNGLSTDILNPVLKDPALTFIPGRAVGEIQTAGLTNFTAGLNGVERNLFHFNAYQVYDDVFLTRGRHSMKFGFGFERDQNNYDGAFQPNGRYDFPSVAAFLTNNPTQFQGLLPGSDTTRGARESIIGMYAQDDFHLRTNLTLNLGLRYEFVTSPTESQGKIANLLNLSDKQPTVGKLFTSTKKNFAPRLGFAWDPFRNGRTSVRGGAGIFDVLPLLYLFVNRFNRTPPFFRTGFVTYNAQNPGLGKFPSQSFAALGPNTFRTIFVESNPPRPYKGQWNLTVQHEILNDFTVELGYVGARGIHLPRAVEDLDIVPPISLGEHRYAFPALTSPQSVRLNTNFGRIAAELWDVNSYYHAFHAGLKKRMSHNVQMQMAYTWQKSIDTSSATFSDNEYGVTIGNPISFDTRFNRGLSDFDLRHNLTVNVLWQVPTPQNWNGLAGVVLGGWQLGSIFNVSTGTPFTVLLNSDRAGSRMSQTRQQLGQRPNLVSSCTSLVNPGNPDNYIKKECFTDPGLGNLGNLGRNTLTGPGVTNLDFSLFKNQAITAISENFKVQFRVEMFNALNHANFALPDVTQFTLFSGGTGTATQTPITSAGRLTRTQTPSRQIQFGLKLIF
ncbi:MAG: TonB-dependent receptor [Blastocatellia bacterium]